MTHTGAAAATERIRFSDRECHEAVLEELARIQESHAFCNSARAKEFLSYVIQHALEGNTESLKERTIGVALFHRSPTYITGDDPIVRVNAAEVRKRLGQYYAEEEQEPKVRIELPVGSYVPRFHFGASVVPAPSPAVEVPMNQPQLLRPGHRWWKIMAAACAIAILAWTLATTARKHVAPKSSLDEFWAPVFATAQPVLICISSPVNYFFSDRVFSEASRSHPGLYDSELKRATNPLQLSPSTPLEWNDVQPFPNEYVGKVHVYAAASLAVIFDRMHKPSQVKIGTDYSFNDLQNSPAVLLGAFDNPWSVRLSSDLPFYLREQDAAIVERGGQGRVWRTGPGPSNPQDFAIVARLLNSKTGQFLVILGGISDPASLAAEKIVSRQDLLDAALRAAPTGWQNRNLEFVIETDRIGDSDSSTRVAAMKSW